MYHCFLIHSSRGKLSSWGLIQDLQDKVRTLRALASLLSQYSRFLLYFTNSMVCLCEWMTHPGEASTEPYSVISRCLVMTEGSLKKGSFIGVLTDLPMQRDTQHPCKGSSQKWAKHVDRTFLSRSGFPGFFDHFIIAWGIKTTNLICQIIDFQRTCDPGCYCVLLLRPMYGSLWHWTGDGDQDHPQEKEM